MSNQEPKTVKEVIDELEKVLMNTYNADGCITSAITEIYKNQFLFNLERIIVPEKKEIPLGLEYMSKYDEDKGFNDCREIVKARIRG